MTKVLFVDDDTRLHDGIRRGLHSARPAWRLAFAESGEAALALLAENTFDAIVTDMEMPGMNGSELLALVAEFTPDLLRMAISGHYDSLTTYSMTSCSHMFLAKPFKVFDFAEMIESALVVHRFEMRRANIWLEDVQQTHSKVAAAELSRDMRQRINRERLKRLGIHLSD